MEELPKIARERLKQAGMNAADQPHPGADLLTGFVERSVSAKEREQVVAHLAVCADCREVVAMSLPPSEVGEIAQPAAAPQSKLGQWKLMRFGVGTATAAVVIAAVLFFKAGESGRDPQTASNSSAQIASVREPSKAESGQRAPDKVIDEANAPVAMSAPRMEAAKRPAPAEAKIAAKLAKDLNQKAAKERFGDSTALDKNAGLMRPATPYSATAMRMSPAVPSAVATRRADSFGIGANENATSAKPSASGAVVGGIVAGNAPAQTQAKGSAVQAMDVSPDALRRTQSSTSVEVRAAAPPPRQTQS